MFTERPCQGARLLLFWEGKVNRIAYDLLEMDDNQQVLPGKPKTICAALLLCLWSSVFNKIEFFAKKDLNITFQCETQIFFFA